MPGEKSRILLVEDDPLVRRSLAAMLRHEGYDVAEASTGTEGAERLAAAPPHLVISDLNLPGLHGMDVLARARAVQPDLPVILITGYGSVEQAVDAMRRGAVDYVTKPILDEEMLLAVRRALTERSLRAENRELRRRLDQRYSGAGMVARDHRMQRIFDTVETVAPTRATVMVTGESGTGKTLVARAIHQNSERRDGPFVEVNCGALPETLLETELFGHVKGAFTGAHADRPGRFAQADGGTIFLDEIHDASPMLQMKLLRVLQDRVFEPVGSASTVEVDVRVVLATNVDLATEVEGGRFRRDLFYRVNVVTLEVPPLRERASDIPALAEHFLGRFAEENRKPVTGLSPAAMECLLAHDWPGNVRELENAVERAVVLCRGTVLAVTDLPPALRDDPPGGQVETVPADPGRVLPLKQALEEPERRIIEHALTAHGGNRNRTAEALGINRTTLFNKMRKFGLLDRY